MWVPVANRRTSLVLVCVLAVASVAVAAPVVASHVTANQIDRVTVSQQSVSATADGSEIHATLRLSNPTPAAVTVPDRGGVASVRVSDNDTTLTRLQGVTVEGGTIPTGGSANVTLVFDVRDDRRETVADGLDGVTVAGEITVEVGGRFTMLSVADTTEGR